MPGPVWHPVRPPPPIATVTNVPPPMPIPVQRVEVPIPVPVPQTVPVPVPVEQSVAVPQTLLTRIRNVVSTMENEMQEESYCRSVQDENINLSSALRMSEEAAFEIAELRRREAFLQQELLDIKAALASVEARMQSERLLYAQEADALSQARAVESQLKLQISELQRSFDSSKMDTGARDTWTEELKRERDELRLSKERLERQLADAQHQLDNQATQSQRQYRTLSEELEKAQLTSRSAHEQLAAKERIIHDLEARLDMAEKGARDKMDLLRQIDELTEQVQSLQRMQHERVTINPVQHVTRTSTIVVHEPRPAARVSLLPGSTDSFVAKVRDAINRAEDAMSKAETAHAATWQSIVAAGTSDDIVLREANLERRSAVDSLAAVEHDLKALMEEVFIEHQLTPQEQETLKRSLRLELEKVESEKALLQSSNPMDGLHTEVKTTLLAPGQAQHAQFENDFTPVHWAAQSGRRDLLAYLLRDPGYQSQLHKRDDFGRLPIAYAQDQASIGLLKRAGSQGRPVESRIGTPRIQDEWSVAVGQVETDGFYAVPWQQGYTLLHFAAETGDVDLANWCLEHYADPDMQDDHGRTPMQMAQARGNHQVAAVMQRFQKPSFGVVRRESARKSVSFVDTRTPTRSSLQHVTEPAGVPSSVPKMTTIPGSIQKTMRMVDEKGWEKMDWKQGYTLLHWAAKHDMPDLCDRFLYQRADPNARDAEGRTAMDIAQAHHSYAASQQLQSGPSTFLREPEDRQVSHSARGSVFVQSGRSRSDWLTARAEEIS